MSPRAGSGCGCPRSGRRSAVRLPRATGRRCVVAIQVLHPPAASWRGNALPLPYPSSVPGPGPVWGLPAFAGMTCSLLRRIIQMTPPSSNTLRSRRSYNSKSGILRATPSPTCGPKPILCTARRFPFGERRPGPPRPAPDGAGPRLVKTPAAVHPLPQGGEGWVPTSLDR